MHHRRNSTFLVSYPMTPASRCVYLYERMHDAKIAEIAFGVLRRATQHYAESRARPSEMTDLTLVLVRAAWPC
jgi:pyruvate/2-oxoacid:ferredoxin oxidoreductase alpha subunit